MRVCVCACTCVCVSQTCVTSELEGGDRSKAMKRLRVPPLGDQVSQLVVCHACDGDEQTECIMCICMYGWMDGCMDGWMHGWMDGLTY